MHKDRHKHADTRSTGSLVEIHPATADRFADVAQILGPANIDAPACWCLAWRVSSGEFNALRGRERPDRLRELCARDPAPGVVAYVDGVPAGWCSFGPRSELERLQRSRTIQRIDDLPVWSVVCFVVRTGFRRQGLAHRMLDAAITYAQSQGAKTLEAYPLENEGARVSGAFAYVGTTSMFEAAGFVKVAPTLARSAGRVRWLMRLDLEDEPVTPAARPGAEQS